MWPVGRRGRRAETVIESYVFPAAVTSVLEPRATEGERPLVFKGLREWCICCAYARGRRLWLPSRAVDAARLAFMSDETAYADFRSRAFGRRGRRGETPLSDDDHAVFRTVRAWDRSRASKRGDSVLWSIDEQLDVETPLGISADALAQIRSDDDPRYGGPFAYGGGTGGGI
jgi:hypothetical protein